VHGGSVLNFGMVSRVELNMHGILACDKKIVCNMY
jgi:hypothetical protein